LQARATVVLSVSLIFGFCSINSSHAATVRVVAGSGLLLDVTEHTTPGTAGASKAGSERNFDSGYDRTWEARASADTNSKIIRLYASEKATALFALPIGPQPAVAGAVINDEIQFSSLSAGHDRLAISIGPVTVSGKVKIIDTSYQFLSAQIVGAVSAATTVNLGRKNLTASIAVGPSQSLIDGSVGASAALPTLFINNGDTVHLEWSLNVSTVFAAGNGIARGAQGEIVADLEHTAKWGGLASVFDLDTNKFIDDIHLTSALGVDWASPSQEVAPVPIPAGAWLFGSAMAGLVFARRRACPSHPSHDRSFLRAF